MRKEMRGIILLFVAVVLGVSLFSYHPADPLLWQKAGNDLLKARNLFGPVGAHLAGGIFRLLGFSSFWLVLLFLALAVLSFLGRSLISPLRAFFAGLFLLLSFSGLLALHWPGMIPYKGTAIIAGGLAGHIISGFLKGFLNTFGAYVLLAVVFIISLMSITRISFGWLLSRFYLWLVLLTKSMREFLVKKRERRRKKKARQKLFREEKSRPKRKMTIVEPKKEPLKKADQESFPFMNVAGEFKLPTLDLLDQPPKAEGVEIQKESLEMNARRLEKKLADFGVEGEVVEIQPGPVITMYEFKPAPGIKISKVAGLSDDLALALRAPSVRIVAPIPGKAAIGIEIPNNKREPVYLYEIFSSPEFKNSTYKLTIALGKDITGAPAIADLARMPHLLVAGATGTGKSVLLNAMINSLLFKASPEMVRFLIIDPKRIELSVYKDIPHLLYPVMTQPKEATRALRWAVEEMERRYMLLSDRGVRNIETYNRKILREKRAISTSDPEGTDKPLPYIILVIDELADLMMASSRQVEEAITRLAQMARAAGIHLIIATQRPSVDVLTGIIKANFPARISFQVSSKFDSRTILDTIGAEHLLGEGDMLFLPPGVGKMIRIHGAYISEEEVKRVTNFLRAQMKPDYDATILSLVSRDEESEDQEIELDDKYDQAVDLVIKTRQASISMIQRKLRVGYNRAARMIEAMEREGIVGPSDGVRPREVFGRKGE
ncbi:MAG: DNA translocase FtsK 4TM domain-containing protein [Deltaproteobacteria bacterium]|nr:DNA translocase FtsK 4TM domain-containing protein [Deltaproteobacteria bacterium]